MLLPPVPQKCPTQNMQTGYECSILTGELEERRDGLLPPLGISCDERQLHQAEEEDQLTSSQGHRRHQVARPHHVKLHFGGPEAKQGCQIFFWVCTANWMHSSSVHDPRRSCALQHLCPVLVGSAALCAKLSRPIGRQLSTHLFLNEIFSMEFNSAGNDKPGARQTGMLRTAVQKYVQTFKQNMSKYITLFLWFVRMLKIKKWDRIEFFSAVNISV